MMDNRLKVIVLGTHDSRLTGHAYSIFHRFNRELFDVRLVTCTNSYPLEGYKSIFNFTSNWEKYKYSAASYIHRIFRLVRFKTSLKIGEEHYHFHDFSLSGISAKRILNKYPEFIPDIIYLHWTSIYLSPKIIWKLHKLTGAIVAFSFVDEQYLSGGCHYHCDCEGYLKGCMDCPALIRGKKYAQYQMEQKLKYWKELPKIVIGVPYDCRKALASPLFSEAKAISNISTPKVTSYGRVEMRKYFGLAENDFVVLVGANDINQPRKGFKYAIDAVSYAAEKYDNICLFVLGCKNNIDFEKWGLSHNVETVTLEFVPQEELFKAFCASDCHLSPTIADSGPMMVNFSIALGVPVVSFNIGVAQDLVLHKRTGYIADYKNSKDLGNGVKFLYSLSTEEREEVCNNCRDVIEKIKQQKPWNETLFQTIKSLKG